MHARSLLEDDGAEIKHFPQSANRFWIAICTDIIGHEIVGAEAKAPRPADPKRQSWQPMVAWVWMLTEAAHRERKRLVKGHMYRLQRGQLVCTERYLAEKANWSRKAAAVFLDRLFKFDMIRLSTATREGQFVLDFTGSKRGPARGPTVTIVTICNYDRYQHKLQPQGANLGAARGPTRGQYLTSNKGTLRESPIASKETEAADGDALADLNGATDLMIQKVVKWMPAGNEIAAREWLGNQVSCYGSDAVRDSFSKLTTEMAEGGLFSRPLQSWCKIAQRLKDAKTAAQDIAMVPVSKFPDWKERKHQKTQELLAINQKTVRA